jgi:hypothetical protein
MTTMGTDRPDVGKVLSGLKDFQRDSVDYIFQRLYLDSDRVSRFLIADEVGLGKTLVARGVIAKAIDHLWDDIDRIDVVYICSNQEIARQNIDRLNITDKQEFKHASRATLLPIKIQKLRTNKMNFVSLTPGTSFNLHSQTGWVWERVVLFNMLREAWQVPEGPLMNVMRADVMKKNWLGNVRWFKTSEQIDPELQAAFTHELDNQPALRQSYDQLAEAIGSRRTNIPAESRWRRNAFIVALRRLLARSSLSALEPDLVILDEFQRFKYLLEEENEFAMLARELFDFPDAKIMLLSATPYKMYTLQGEPDENHYEDFERTVKFLLNGRKEDIGNLKGSINAYRKGLLRLGKDDDSRNNLLDAKSMIEGVLRKVMVRTERLAVTADRNGMLREQFLPADNITPQDLCSFVYLDKIAQEIQAGDQVEYWKSSSYQLNLMETYKLKRRFEDICTRNPGGIFELLQDAQGNLLQWETIQQYQQIDPGNARLRALSKQNLDSGNWRLLWLPACLPYYHPDGPYTDLKSDGETKSLIFSAWRVVPKVISVLISYEAERRMLGADHDIEYSDLTRKRSPLLRFALSQGRLTGMSVFTLIYPCQKLMRDLDPLTIAKEILDSKLVSLSSIRQHAMVKVKKLLERIIPDETEDTSGPEDERWYWAALIMLDKVHYPDSTSTWLDAIEDELDWKNMLKTGSEEDQESRFADHVRELVSAYKDSSELRLGRPPMDLAEVLTDIAIAGPAVTALRALMRCVGVNKASPAFLAAAAQVGLGFRTLFNQPDAIMMLQNTYPEKPYWNKVLQYCADGNLQAVLDEYDHVLLESLGLVGHDPGEAALKMAFEMRTALSIRSPSLRFDEIVLEEPSEIQLVKRGIRCRYALRFGVEKNEAYDGGSRDTDVRVAFNSPFRPFILATTSVGQEGLDFHQYCHRVVHWNLPSNPVDLEQREGRVHRYKGHVIRRNLADKYGFETVNQPDGDLTDPWRQIFEQASSDRPEGSSELIPFWVVDHGRYAIERQVPILPLSREVGHYERLKKSLVAYRSVIGQPRQEELLTYLQSQLTLEELREISSELSIDLSPPRNNVV